MSMNEVMWIKSSGLICDANINYGAHFSSSLNSLQQDTLQAA